MSSSLPSAYGWVDANGALGELSVVLHLILLLTYAP